MKTPYYIWNAATEIWEPFDFDHRDKKWWFQIVKSAWGFIVYAHTKTIAGKQFHIYVHPKLPGRYLGRY